MSYNIVPLNELINQFSRLPGIGKKTAQRLAYNIIEQPPERAKQFAEALINAREKIHLCKNCQSLTDKDICEFCSDEKRDRAIICVVEDPRDVMAFERTREYKGLYHVLHGVISPLDNVGPEQLKIKELMARLSNNDIKEIIFSNYEIKTPEICIMDIEKPWWMGDKIERLKNGNYFPFIQHIDSFYKIT